MGLLLDTHALLWFAAGDTQLPPRVRVAIHNAPGQTWVSAASAWEIATKVRLGKLPYTPLATSFVARAKAGGFRILGIHAQDAQEAGNFPGHHGDPFDRMLVAQAFRRGLVLVSNEKIFDQYGVQRLWS